MAFFLLIKKNPRIVHTIDGDFSCIVEDVSDQFSDVVVEEYNLTTVDVDILDDMIDATVQEIQTYFAEYDIIDGDFFVTFDDC